MTNPISAFFEEFKRFALRGNVVDMAVGVIIGGAFGKIISSLVDDVLMPPLGMLIGNVDFSRMSWTLLPASAAADGKAVAIAYGNFIQTLISFVIIALCVFVLVKLINSLHHKEPPPAPPAAPPEEVKLLGEIRDLLKASQAN